MAATLVQSKTVAASSATSTATFDSSPTDGNLLIAIVAYVGNSGFATTPTGWAQAAFSGGSAHGFVTIWYKVAGAGESSTVTFTVSTLAVGSIAIFEYSGMTATPFDVGAQAAAAYGTSIGTGTTATIAQADELLIAAVATPEVTRTFSNTWGNGFTQLSQHNRQETASLVVASTGAYTTSEAWTGASWGVGCIAAFKIAVSGTNMKINIADTFKDVSEVKINIGDTWKTVTKVQVNIGNIWKTVFG